MISRRPLSRQELIAFHNPQLTAVTVRDRFPPLTAEKSKRPVPARHMLGGRGRFIARMIGQGEHVYEEFRALSVATNATNFKTTFLEHRQLDTSVLGRLDGSDVFGDASQCPNDHGHNFWNRH